MLTIQIHDIEMYLDTDPDLFSPNKPDRGTCLMLEHVAYSPADIVLDLGCGYGLVGIYSAKHVPQDQVYMTDLDPLAVRLAARNLQRNNVEKVTLVQGDGYEAVNRADFTLILSNPPFHTDFSVAKNFIEKGFNRLHVGGRLYMVTRRKEWYKRKIISVFGGVQIWEEEGYFVFMAQKKNKNYAVQWKKK